MFSKKGTDALKYSPNYYPFTKNKLPMHAWKKINNQVR